MKGKYSDSCPFNSRVNVNYRTGKVNFDYPRGQKRRTFKHKLLMIYATLQLTYFFVLSAIAVVYLFFSVIIPLVNAPPTAAGVSSSGWELFTGINYPLFYFVFFPPFIAAVYMAWDYEAWSKIYPVMNYTLARGVRKASPKYHAEVKKLTEPRFEIPLFSNVLLDYQASGEFGEKLEEIDIREYPILEGPDFEDFQDHFFKAVFTFSSIPRTGSLKLAFM